MGGGLGPDEGQPDRVEFVQGGEFARRVPPFRRHGREFGHFAGIYGGSIEAESVMLFRGLSGSGDPVYVGRRNSSGQISAMATIAMKFGGTSVADMERIRHVAGLVKREVERGNKVAVVVSAMAGETNKLVAWTNDAAKPPGRLAARSLPGHPGPARI